MDLDRIRNFSIIAHIDHGKSTLSDRILEVTGAVDARDMREQYLDSMDLERERGITIKAQNVRVDWKGHVFHLIDTPGHVDFGYEVSRSLAACEGVVLVVDAAQGIEAQTLANCYLALEHDLEIVAALNKIDLPAADPDRYAMEIENVLGIAAEDILRISAKTGEGVPELLDAVVERIPPPAGDADAPLQALIFDSQFDQYRGVVSSVRVMNGRLARRLASCGSCRPARTHEAIEIGVRRPVPTPVAELGPGEVGYLIAGIKDVGEARSGETVTTADATARPSALPGYRDPKPMVFSGLFPIDGDDFENLRESLEKLKLNDASITYTPETSGALGFGFRCGFLGLLHMEIVKERLEREFDLALIATAPSVEYRVHRTDGDARRRRQPGRPARPAAHRLRRGAVLPGRHHHADGVHRHADGAVPAAPRRDDKLEYLSPERVELHYLMPARRGRRRLLRPDEEPQPGLRQPRLRAGRLPPLEPRQGRPAAQRRAGRRLLDDRPPRQGLRLRPADDREAAEADPAADVRRADPGGDRRQGHRPRDGARRSARTCSPSATAATSPASASCSRSRRRARRR